MDPTSPTDPIYVPDQYTGVVKNTSTSSGIADIAINGVGVSQWYSASSIGDITANSFAAGFIAQAGTDIGNIQSYTADIAGHFQAGGNIGDVTSAASIVANLVAGGNLGAITGVTGGLTGNFITTGGNIGDITVIQLTPALTQITAGGNIGNIYMDSGQWDAAVEAQNIGNVTDASGNFINAVFVAQESIGDISVTSKEGDAISGGSITAGVNIGNVTAYAYGSSAIVGTLIQGGDQPGDLIAGVTGISYGVTVLPPVTPGVNVAPAAEFNGIDSAQILAASIGPILGQGYVGTGINQVTIHSQVGDIASITGIGNGYGIYSSTVVADAGIGPISGQSTAQGDGINGGSFDANGAADPQTGGIGQITGQGGPAGGNGIIGSRFQATGEIAGLSGTANANGGNAISTITTYATSYGQIDATVLGGQLGNGIVGSTIRAWSDYTNNRPTEQIAGITVNVNSALGLGITDTTVTSKGDLVTLSSTALNAAAISGSTFTLSQGVFGSIYAQSINSGNAIENCTFTASNGSITTATDLASAAASGITAIANGTSISSSAIVGSTFTADENIGVISATANGGTAILNSTFTADSDYGNAGNGPNLPGPNPGAGADIGALLGINATSSGQHLAASAGIAGSAFAGELITSVTVNVTDREEGGPGIIGSTFTARNAVYDGNGNFNNEGTIGAINVTDGSLSGNGIDTAQFIAGAGGSIGDINVTTLGGVGIYGSTFSASTFDYDQADFNSTIGNITVNTGRAGGQLVPLPPPPNDAWTALPAGISTSYFAANSGISSVTVNSIGTGVFFSAFLANGIATAGYGLPGLILPFLAPAVPGNIGNISITSTGRFGAGSIFSLFAGTNLGNINLQVASRDPSGTPVTFPNIPGPIGAAFQFVETLVTFTIRNVGPAASAASIYVATNGSIGQINVGNSGPGPDSIASAFVALPWNPYGPVSNFLGVVTGNLFWGIPRLFGSPSTPAVIVTGIVPPIAGIYNADDTLNFEVNFSGPVAVTGQPSFAVQVGSVTRQALYHSGSGSAQLLFSLTIDPGDSGNVMIPSGTSVQADIANRIVNSSTGAEITQLTPSIGSTSGISVDTTPPTVTSLSPILSSPAKSGASPYSVRELLTVLVTFSEAVLVQGSPMMVLDIGKYSRSLVYYSGSGTSALRFTYRVTRADVNTHQVATTSGEILFPAKSTITDVAGTSAVLAGTRAAVSFGAMPRARATVSSNKIKAARTARSHPALAKRTIAENQGQAF